MIFAVFAAGINAGRQIGDKTEVEVAADERAVELGPFDAAQHGAKAERDEGRDQLARVALPNWKNTGHAELGEVLFAVGPQIGEENVAVADVEDAAGKVISEFFTDERFVVRVC